MGWIACVAFAACSLAQDEPAYRAILAADAPVAYWSFDEQGHCCTPTQLGVTADAFPDPGVSLAEAGPRPPDFPIMAPDNNAAIFHETSGVLRIKDGGTNSPFRFIQGETISVDLWVWARTIEAGQSRRLLGKGATALAGPASLDQNWAVALTGVQRDRDKNAEARMVFEFRSSPTQANPDGLRHRWISDLGFITGRDWVHLAVTYTFGDPSSIRAWVHGVATSGRWDLDGPTVASPWVSAGDLWIGGGAGPITDTQFLGALDEVAIYRRPYTGTMALQRTRPTQPKTGP
jgi:hypothetical protein